MRTEVHEGFVKPLSEKIETPAEREARLSQFPTYQRVKGIKESFDGNVTVLYPDISDFNIDTQCVYSSDEYDEETSFFASEKMHTYFEGYFARNCMNSKTCSIDPSFSHQLPKDPATFNYTDYDQPLDLLSKINDRCLQRMVNKKVTS
mmetsp:Transcript_4428/g.6509  ORF Transcript_4428/g.6509 Transcript_4428/m.6509 type:complete len:148 (+) Transcript_4428:3585-4028(+)